MCTQEWQVEVGGDRDEHHFDTNGVGLERRDHRIRRVCVRVCVFGDVMVALTNRGGWAYTQKSSWSEVSIAHGVC